MIALAQTDFDRLTVPELADTLLPNLAQSYIRTIGAFVVLNERVVHRKPQEHSASSAALTEELIALSNDATAASTMATHLAHYSTIVMALPPPLRAAFWIAVSDEAKSLSSQIGENRHTHAVLALLRRQGLA